MATAVRLLEPIVVMGRLMALPPQMALHPFIRRIFPALDGSVIMNPSSPMRDAAFRQYLCDRALVGKTGAKVYDIGGTGQVSTTTDSRGRIAQATDVNRNSPRTDRRDDLLQIQGGSADLLILCRCLEYYRDDEILPFFIRAFGVLRRTGFLVVCSPQFSTVMWIDALFRRLYSLTSPLLAGTRLTFRTVRDVQFMLERAGFQVDAESYPSRFGLGQSFILFARPQRTSALGPRRNSSQGR